MNIKNDHACDINSAQQYRQGAIDLASMIIFILLAAKSKEVF